MEAWGQNKTFCEKWSQRTYVMLQAKGNNNNGWLIIIPKDDKECLSMGEANADA